MPKQDLQDLLDALTELEQHLEQVASQRFDVRRTRLRIEALLGRK